MGRSLAQIKDSNRRENPPPRGRCPWRSVHPLPLAVILALALRLAILATNSVPFNSDEAVVALMARHTLQGDWPIFFYGQSYMGSLDATLIAAAFALLGESVLVIRLVQTALFIGVVITTYLLGVRFFGDRWTAGAAAMLVALPTVLVSTYTTATLGGYGEILLLGNIVLLLGHAVVTDRPHDWRCWFGLGAAAGLGFWTSALITVYLLPVGAVIIAARTRPPSPEQPARSSAARHPGRWAGVALAAAAFFAFSGPWWWHNMANNWSALGFALTGAEASGIGIGQTPVSTRLAAIALLGLPALIGFRFPWSAEYILLPLAVPALALYLAVLASAARSWRQASRDPGRSLLLGMGGAFIVLFMLSRFGTDATGRYFLPLTIPLALLTAALLKNIHSHHRWLGALALAFLLGSNLLANGLAMSRTPPGLTTQFDPSNRFDNRSDTELIAFLHETGAGRGYSNYFVAFRIAFLSQETVILSSRLPYKPDLSYNPADDRYPPYTAEVAEAENVVFVTSIHPKLDALLAERLLVANVGFAEKQIGPYHVFYDLSRKVSPGELGLGSP